MLNMWSSATRLLLALAVTTGDVDRVSAGPAPLQGVSAGCRADHAVQGGIQRRSRLLQTFGDANTTMTTSHAPPQHLQRQIHDEVKLVEEDFEFPKRNTDMEELMEKQQDVYPYKQDMPFLNRVQAEAVRRKRRMAESRGRAFNIDPSGTEGHEIIKYFLDRNDPGLEEIISKTSVTQDKYVAIKPKSNKYQEGFIPSSPKGFAQYFSLLLKKIPNIRAPAMLDFFPSLILGAILTLPDSGILRTGQEMFARIENVNIDNYRSPPPRQSKIHRVSNTDLSKLKHNILKTGFKVSKDGEVVVVLKTFIAGKHSPTSGQEPDTKQNMDRHFKEELDKESKYSMAELQKISEIFEISGSYSIEEQVFYIASDHSLSVKRTVTSKTRYECKVNNEGKLNFKKISYTNSGANLQSAMEKISKNTIQDVETGIESLSNCLLQIYSDKGNDIFGFNKDSEATFHAFFYGSLSLNFKYRYDLDVWVERVAGKGFADLILVSRKNLVNNDKYWYAIPVIVEFKADGTPASSAIGQITGTGYQYNLSLKTLSKKAVIVGINSKTRETQVQKGGVDIPPPANGFIGQLLLTENSNEDYNTKIQEELKHLYFSISPSAIKTDKINNLKNDHYLSRLILGQLLASDNIDVHVKTSTDHIITFVLKQRKSNSWIMLNIIESSQLGNNNKYEFKDPEIPDQISLPQDVSIGNYHRVDVKINPRSDLGWSEALPKRNTPNKSDMDQQGHPARQYYFQSVNKVMQHATKTSNDYKKLDSIKFGSVESITIRALSGNEITNAFASLSATLESVKEKKLISSESDFQAVVQGLFLGKQKQAAEIIKVFVEANPSTDGRIDLVISQLEVTDQRSNRVHEKTIVVVELKYGTFQNQKEIDTCIKEAKKQVEKYRGNLKSFTDLDECTEVVAVYDQTNGKISLEVTGNVKYLASNSIPKNANN